MSAPQPNDVHVICHACGARLLIRRGRAGIAYKCPKCTAILDVFKPPDAPVARQVLEPTPKVSMKAAEESGVQYNVCPGVDQPPPGSSAYRKYFPVICPVCHARMSATEEQVGQSLLCPDCLESVVVPPPPTPKPAPPPRITTGYNADDIIISPGIDQPPPGSPAYRKYFAVVCPLCHTRMTATEDQIGQSLVCPDCRRSVVIEAPPPPRPKRRWTEDDGIEIPIEATFERPTIVVPMHESKIPDEPVETYVRDVPLPRWPLLTGVFNFPVFAGVWQRWIGLGMWLAAALWLVQLDIRLISDRSLGTWVAALFCSMLVAVVCAGWWVTIASVLLVIVEETSDGLDRIEGWPETIFSRLRDTLFMVNAHTLAAVPGFALSLTLNVATEFGWLAGPLSAFILFPVVLLAMLANDSPLIPISVPVWRSLKTSRSAWVLFYLESVPMLGLAGVIAWTAWGYAWKYGAFWALALAALAILGTLLIYFRLLGRVAWICAVQSVDEDDDEALEEESDVDDAVGAGSA